MKKTLILFLAIILLLTASSSALTSFSPEILTALDTDRHWAEDSIRTLKELGIMNGYDGNINPDSIITRGEFTAIITRAFDLRSDGNSSGFADIGREHIFFENINAAANAGIIDGFPDNTFRPDNMITREEIMLILSRIRTGESNHAANFTDIEKSYKYYTQLSNISGDGIINGYPDGSFRPYARTTRAEGASMVLSAMKKYLPAADVSAVKAVVHEYIPLHFSDSEKTGTYLTGEAKADRKYIDYTYDYSEKLGYGIENAVNNPDITSVEQHGPLTIMKVSYYISKSVNSSAQRYYKGESEIGVITRGKIIKIYSHNTRIVYETPINLTWEINSKAPDYETTGVNIVSPTSFAISPKNETASAKKLGSDSAGSIYFNSTLTADYVNWAKQKDYDVWAMYKTDFTTDTANRFLNNPHMRLESINTLIEKILYFGLDGLNLDFENMLSTDRGVYTNHVKEISLMAHTLGTAVSADVTVYMPSSLTWSMCYDRDAIARFIDYVIIMAYDQYYSGSPVPGPVAGFEWTAKTVETTLTEVEADKLILGMPFYIRYWETINGKSVSSKALSMSQAQKYVTDNNAVASWDSKHELMKYSWTKNGKECMLWMENAESIRRRVQLCELYELAGVASWRRGFETADVWNAISEEIK